MNLNAGISPALELEPGVTPTVAVTVCGSALLTVFVAISMLIPGQSARIASIDFETAAVVALQADAPVSNLFFGRP